MQRIMQVCCLLLLISGRSLAQDNEVNFSVGPSFATDQKLQVTSTLPGCQVLGCTALTTFKANTTVAFAAGYARRFTNIGPVALYLELPLLRVPEHDLKATSTNSSIGPSGLGRTSAFFLTPSARIQFLPKGEISPWVSAGYGFAHLAQSFSSSTHTKGAAQFGGGVDVRVLPHLAVRGEVRDFGTGGMLQSGPIATLTQGTALTDHIQQIYVGGGVVLKF
jgi:opacity protein-like surface antigen